MSHLKHKTTQELVNARNYERGRECAHRERRRAIDAELSCRQEFDPQQWPGLSSWQRGDIAHGENEHAAIVDLRAVPYGWWVYGIFHNHSPIKFAGDKHVPLDPPWTCKLQHVEGGRLLAEDGKTPREALALAAAMTETL
jgi:hypothetical protein